MVTVTLCRLYDCKNFDILNRKVGVSMNKNGITDKRPLSLKDAKMLEAPNRVTG